MTFRHPKRRRSHTLSMPLITGGLWLGALLAVSQAQVPTTITPDGTLGTAVTQSGNIYNITGGTRPGHGPHLFHSFDRFNVGTNDTARFSGPTGIENILSRVTGGTQSVIDGRLQSTILGANLYLLNPSGVLFGPNATLDVSGSFHVSTADYLRFADGASFSAHVGEKSTLSVASPAAFGFLAERPAPVTIHGSSLQVSPGKAVSVAGGDITILGTGSPITDDTIATLAAPGGRIQLASVASPGEVGFNPLELAADLQVDSFARLGRLELSRGALLDASSNRGGTVLLRSGRLLVDGSAIFADNLGPTDGVGLGVDLRITADTVMTNGAVITADSLGAGRARDLRLHVGTLTLTGGAAIFSSTLGAGRGGDLIVTATEAISISGRGEDLPSGLFSNTFGGGSAGHLFVSAPTLSMDGGVISVGSRRAGRAGNIMLEVGRLTLAGGAIIDSSTIRDGPGGSVMVTATDSVVISGRGEDFPSGFLSLAGGRGDAGRVRISTPLLIIRDGGVIRTTTLGAGRAGDIVLEVGRLEISGRDNQGLPSGLFSETRGPGPGGDLHLTATHIQLSHGGTISARSTRDGTAGSLLIQAGETLRSQEGAVTTESARAGGGRIVLRAGRLVELRDSEITTSVRGGGGDAGNLSLTAPFVVLQGSQVVANAFEGRGGNVRIGADVFLADPASGVSASSTLGISGTVDIQAPVTNLSGVVTPLPPDFAPAIPLLHDRCAARLREGTVSSLVERGREGLPASPEGLLPSRSYRGESNAASPTRETATGRRRGLRPDAKGRPQSQGRSASSATALAREPECAAR